MSDYELTWITENLAAGHAPMSFADLGVIRDQGIDCIVNLCGEYCDLHEIEQKSDFEVYYLPIPDESTPDMADMEKALDWMDEAIYLGKKVLVHCRFGVGRTGTFITAYLVRKGLGLKLARKKLKKTRVAPSSYRQWRLLKKLSKKSGELRIREPSLESGQVVDLLSYFEAYEDLVARIEASVVKRADSGARVERCGSDTDGCCFRYFDLELIEAIYLHNRSNRLLNSDLRREVIQRALEVSAQVRGIRKGSGGQGGRTGADRERLREEYGRRSIRCPLSIEKKCILYDARPIGCRLFNVTTDGISEEDIDRSLKNISRDTFLAFTGKRMENGGLTFSMADTVSGRFVQRYFYYLAALQPGDFRDESD